MFEEERPFPLPLPATLLENHPIGERTVHFDGSPSRVNGAYYHVCRTTSAPKSSFTSVDCGYASSIPSRTKLLRHEYAVTGKGHAASSRSTSL